MDQAITALQILYKEFIKNNPDSEMACIKEVFWWDPIKIPHESLPAIYIEPTWTPFTFNIGYAQRQFSITIWYAEALIDHVTWEWCDVVEVKKRVVRIMEWVDTNGKILFDSIIWILYWMTCLQIVNDDGETINVAHDVNNIQTQYEIQETLRWKPVYQWTVTFTIASAAPTF